MDTDMMDKTPDEQARLAALEAREQALADKERNYFAMEELQRRGLPGQLLAVLDQSSDQALNRALDLAQRLYSLARSELAGAGAPKAGRPGPQDAGKLSYWQRAQLYLGDREAYREMTGGSY